jgi:DNA recombination protein RmuC
MDTPEIIIMILLVCVISLVTILLVKIHKYESTISKIPDQFINIEKQLNDKAFDSSNIINMINLGFDSKLSNLKNEFNNSFISMQTTISGLLTSQITESTKKEIEKIDLLIKTLSDQLNSVKLSVDNNTNQTETKLENIRTNFNTNIAAMQTALITSLHNQMIEESTKQREKLDILIKTISDQLISVKNSLDQNTTNTETKLENIRLTVEKSIKSLETENSAKLDAMREVVDEKLQKTLDDKLSKSFKIVSDSLQQVFNGLTEMQTLAVGVGDLKKVLSNVKTRGILGETQLGSILEQILTKEQYDKNIITKKGSRDPVEFAIKMPGSDNGFIYLPIDAKFPLDSYSALLAAYDTGNVDEIKNAKTNLVNTIKKFGKDIFEKYIDVPNTTDFGIMFLPVEGLYAEVVQTGVTEDLQRDYKINVAGPSTMAALLNSLQMGFKTLAIQKRSGEVWKVLGAVKTEFNNFQKVLESTQQRINQASDDLEKLVGVRTRKIQKHLNEVTVLPEVKDSLINLDGDEEKVTE